MKPIFHPQLVNDPFGDPALYVEFLFEKRGLLFDLGDIAALATRRVLRLSHVFVSHTHMDHFVGFDRLLRLCLGRDKSLQLWGPPGFIDRVAHKLGAYTWNLVQNYDTDFTLVVAELHADGPGPCSRFRCRSQFARENLPPVPVTDGVLLDEDTFRIRAAVLDHKIPCLGFALEEKFHINVWKNRLTEMGLPTGPWLRELKAAVVRGEPDDTPFRIWWRDQGQVHERTMPLAQLRDRLLRVVDGQKLAYVVDVVYHAQNARRIVDLVRDADFLFIEATFLDEDAHLAAEKHHLTARQAGTLAAQANVKRLIPFHFSARYPERREELEAEAREAWVGKKGAGSGGQGAGRTVTR